MAVGSWVKTPLYPGINNAAGIIEKYMRKPNQQEDKGNLSD